MNHDTIQHSMTWHDVAKNSFTSSCDPHFHRIDSVVLHLQIQFTLNLNVLQLKNKFNKIIKNVLFLTFDVLVGFS